LGCALCAVLAFVACAVRLHAANAIQWSAINFPATASAGSNISFTAAVTNTGDTTWDSGFYLELKDAAGTHLYYPSISGIPPGGSTVATFYLSLPFAPGTYTYGFTAMRHGYEYFGGTQTRVVQATTTAPPPAPPAQSVVWLSSYGFLSVAAPTIDTNWSPSPSYKLRAKFPNPADSLGWHATDRRNNKGLELEALPPPGTYYPVTLYWLRYDDSGNTLQEIGPGSLRSVTIADPAVLLSSYWFNQTVRPTVTINQRLPKNYKLAVRLVNTGTNAGLADSWNNDTRYLDHIPAPGTYTIEIFWQKYDETDTTIIDSGVPVPRTITIVDGPNRVFTAAGYISADDSYDEEGTFISREYRTDYHEIYVPVAGQLRLFGAGFSNRGLSYSLGIAK